MHPLHGVRLKLVRAEEHFNALKTLLRTFIASQPYTFAIEPNPKPPDYVIVAWANRAIPDDKFSVIIGDFAHNARSALDLLVQQLTSLPDNSTKRFGLQFPIFDDRSGPKGYTSKVKRYLCGVASQYETIIEGFQPYKRTDGPNDDPLGILRTINDADKHRIIHIVGAIASFNKLDISGPGRLGSNVLVGSGARMGIGHRAIVDFGGFRYEGVGDGVITKDRTIVAKITAPQPSQVNMHPNAQISIKFGVGNPRVEGRLAMDTLSFIYNRVKEVITEFAPFFPQ
jgi:hypothetical protein